MNRYDLIHTGPACPNNCRFCTEHDGAYSDTADVCAEIAAASLPRNLYFGQGDAAASPGLTHALRFARSQGIRVKLKTTGEPLLRPGRLKELVDLGALLYEIEFLGPNATTHDSITGRRGSFREAQKAVKLIRAFAMEHHPIGHPFLFLTVPVCRENVAWLPDITCMLAGLAPDRIVYRHADEVSYSRSVSALRACVEESLRKGVWPVLSGFPFCTVQGLEYHCQEVYDRQVRGEIHDFCEPCVLRQVCCGVRAGYIPAFGRAELEAIRWHRNADAINRIASMETVLLSHRRDEEDVRVTSAG